jgi:RNA polymerase sigma-70 factor (ECF subfamily)
MARIVQNTSIDIRRLKSFQVEEKSDSFDTNVHTIEKVFIDTNGIDTKKLIEGLDEKYAFVLEHLYLKGYSQSELADEFDIPIGTIKTRIKKGIQILRTQLDKEKKFILGIFLITLITIIVGIL